MEFDQQAQWFLEKAAKQYGAPYEITYDVTCGGAAFPMTAGYTKREGRNFLGIKVDIPLEGMCGETCFFLCRETLDEAEWARLCEIFRAVHDEIVPAGDPDHTFTLVSFVVFTNQVVPSVQRKIRRIKDERNYTDGKFGWSSLRLCVREESSDSYYCNSMGKAVLECLTRDGMPQPRKRFLGIF